MKSSEYNQKYTREMTISGIKGWRKKIKIRETENRGFYRSAKSTLKNRVQKKLLERETWYKEGKRKEDEEPDEEEEKKEKGRKKSEMKEKK